MSLRTASLALIATALGAAAQSCPGVHVFGARETTASPGYGSTQTVVQSIVNSYSGATSEVRSTFFNAG
jgi:acetylxylan esterase